MGNRSGRSSGRGGRSSDRRSGFRGRKAKGFYTEKIGTHIDYKNIETLKLFVTERGKIRPRRQTGISAAQQHMIAKAVKRARHMALLPFVDDNSNA